MPYKHVSLYSLFRKHNGLLALRNKIPIKDNFSLSLVYTPGVGRSCLEIQKNEETAHLYTNKSNSMLVVTDSSGFYDYTHAEWHNNIAIPYVEGISFYYKTLGNIDAYPIVLDHHLINNGKDLAETIMSLVPGYSAIELYSIDENRLNEAFADLVPNKKFVLFTTNERNHLLNLLKKNTNISQINPLFLITCLLRAALDTKAYIRIPIDLIDKIIDFLIKNGEDFNHENLFTQANILIGFCAEYLIENKLSTLQDISMQNVFNKYEAFLLEGSESWYDPILPNFKSNLMSLDEQSLHLHRRLSGMIESSPKINVKDPKALNALFTEKQFRDVADNIKKHPEIATKITCKRNFSAIVTNGTAVLGFGDIGTLAGLPVMEGKSCLFKQLGGVDLVPLCISAKKSDFFRLIVSRIAPIFNAINLEDIKAPECFEIEKPLEEKLDIPIFHDDQHGTAIVVIAGLLNSLKLVHKKANALKIIVNGGGAAGLSITELLLQIGCRNIIVCDTQGAIYEGRVKNMNENKNSIAKITNPFKIKGFLVEVIKESDVFIGVSAAGVLSPQMIKSMAEKPIVFALANPVPEIMPFEAKKAGAYIIATGRSDFQNQVNNSLAFPGIFRGILDVRSQFVTLSMKLAAAKAISELVHEDKLSPDYIIPNALDSNVPIAVAKAVAKEAIHLGIAKDKIDPDFVEENTRQFLIGGNIRTTKFICL